MKQKKNKLKLNKIQSLNNLSFHYHCLNELNVKESKIFFHKYILLHTTTAGIILLSWWWWQQWWWWWWWHTTYTLYYYFHHHHHHPSLYDGQFRFVSTFSVFGARIWLTWFCFSLFFIQGKTKIFDMKNSNESFNDIPGCFQCIPFDQIYLFCL